MFDVSSLGPPSAPQTYEPDPEKSEDADHEDECSDHQEPDWPRREHSFRLRGHSPQRRRTARMTVLDHAGAITASADNDNGQHA